MADSPEIPEAIDRFETSVAITIAVVAVVIASVAILARLKFLCIGSMVLALVGSVIGISSHFM